MSRIDSKSEGCGSDREAALLYWVEVSDPDKGGGLSESQEREFISWLNQNLMSVEPGKRDEKLCKLAAIVTTNISLSRPTHIKGKQVTLPPGYTLAAVTQFMLTRKAYSCYVEPVIADMQQEYIDAIAKGDSWHARWIAVRGHLLVIPGWLYAFVAGRLVGLLRRGR